MRRSGLMILLVSALIGCGGEGGIGEEQVGEVVSDASLMKEATAAANDIIRNQTDCEAVKSNVGDVNEKLDTIATQIQTSTAETSLAALRRQVSTIADACGAR